MGALIWVGAGSLLTLLLFIAEPLATRAVALSLAYGADLIIAAYILVVIAAIVFTIRRRMPPAKTVTLLVGRRDHPGRRDRPAVRVPAAAAWDRQLPPPQSRCPRAAQL